MPLHSRDHINRPAGDLGQLSMLLPLEPRFMFDAAVAAEVADIAGAMADAGDGHGADAGESHDSGSADFSTSFDEGNDVQTLYAAPMGITPFSGDYGPGNDAPKIDITGINKQGDEDTTFPITGIVVSDPEGDTLHVTIEVDKGQLFLSPAFDSGVTIYASVADGIDGTGYSKITIEGQHDHINAVLAGLKYRGPGDYNGEAELKITAIEKDPANASWHDAAVETVEITVDSVNDMPTLDGAPVGESTWTVPEETWLSFGPGSSNFTINDVDEGDTLTVRFAVKNGILAFDDETGITARGIDGEWSYWEFTGTSDKVNQFIEGMKYQGELDYAGSDTLRITADDGGGLQTWDVKIDVTAVDDDPVWEETSDIPFVVDEGGYTKLDGTHLNITDVDTDPSQIILKIEGVPDPTKGVLQMEMANDVWITLGKDGTFSYQDLCSGRIRYMHSGQQVRESINSGSESDTLVFSVENIRDEGNQVIASGEITLDVTLKPVNQSPFLPEDGGICKVYEGQRNAIISFDIDDADQAANADYTVTIESLPVDGLLYYYTGTNWIKVNVGMQLSMASVKAGNLVYHHNGYDGAQAGMPIAGTRADGFSITVTDDGGGAGVGSEITTGSLNITIDVVQSNDLPTGALPGGAVAGSKPIGNAHQFIPIDNNLLNVTDVDSLSSALTYTLQEGDYKGRLYYKSWNTSVWMYREIAVGSSFTQADVNADRIVYRYDGGYGVETSEGSGSYVHNGTDAFKFTVRDGSVSIIDADGYYHQNGFEGGVGTWVGGTVVGGEMVNGVLVGGKLEGGAWELTDVYMNMNVNMTTGSGGTPEVFPIIGKSEIAFDGDKSATVYEGSEKTNLETKDFSGGGYVDLSRKDLYASINYSYTENGDTSTLNKDDPGLTYRIESALEHGKLLRREYTYDEVAETTTFTNKYVILSSRCSFTQRDVDVGAIRYVHGGEESTADSVNLSLSDGTVEYTSTITLNFTVLPVNDTPSVEGSLIVKEGPTGDQRDANEGGFDYEGVVLDSKVIDFFQDADIGGKNNMEFVVVDKPLHGGIYKYNGSGDRNDITNWTEITYASEGKAKGATNWTGLLNDTNDTNNPVTVISMQNLRDGTYHYIHNGGEVFTDALNIIANDGQGKAYGGVAEFGSNGNSENNVIFGWHGSSISEIGVIAIEITPVNDKPVETNNDGMTVGFGNPSKQVPGDFTASELGQMTIIGESINPGNRLHYDDIDNDPNQVIYRITTSTQNGKMYHFKDGRWIAADVGSVFSQKDINDGNIIYIHNGIENKSEHADSFAFDISDGDSAKRDSGTFDIKIDMENVAPEIVKNKGDGHSYYLDKSTGMDFNGYFTINDADYNAGPTVGGGISNDYMQVMLEANKFADSTSWGYFKLGYTTGIEIITNTEGKLVIRGSHADLQTALDSITFLPKSDETAPVDDINARIDIKFTLNDLANGDKNTTQTDVDSALPNDILLTLPNAKQSIAEIIVWASPINDEPAFTNSFEDAPTSVIKTIVVGEDETSLIRDKVGYDITIFDPDEFSRNINEVTLSVGPEGVLNLDTKGLQIITGKNGTNSITLRGTNEAINDALKTLTYTASSDYSNYDPGTPLQPRDTLTISYYDGDSGHVDWGTGDGGRKHCEAYVEIIINPVNDEPIIIVNPEPIMVGASGSNGYAVTWADGSYIKVDDPNDLNPPGYCNTDVLEVTLSVVKQGTSTAFGTLAVDSASYPGVAQSGNGTDTLVLKGTRDDVNAALESLRYTAPTLPGQNSLVDLKIHVDDHGNGSAVAEDNVKTADGTVSLMVNDGNDAPVIGTDVLFDATLNEDGDIVFSGNNLITVTDPDSMDFRIQVEISVENGMLELGSTSHFSKKDTLILSADGKSITIIACQSSINKALDGMKYTPTANWNGIDHLTITANDLGHTSIAGDAAQIVPRTIDITVNPQNDAPSIIPGSNPVIGDMVEDVEDTTGTTIDSAFGGCFRDPSDEVADGNGSQSNAFIGVWVASDQNAADMANKGTWQYFDSTSTSWKTIAQNMFIRKDVAIRFDPVANFNSQTDTGTGGAKGAVPDLEVRLVESTQDRGAYEAVGADLETLCDLTTGQTYLVAALLRDGNARYTAVTNLSLNVVAANDAPDIVYTGSGTSSGTPITVSEDTSLAFTGSNLISFTDPDWNERTGGDVTVTLSVGHGKLNLGTTTGLTFENGTANDGNVLKITGSLDDINAAVAGLTYKGDDNYNGTDSLSVHITDKGNASASGGPLTVLDANQTIHIQVDAVNDAPTLVGGVNPSIPDIVEDIADGSNTGTTVDNAFGGCFSDAKDDVGDSESNAFIGVWATSDQNAADMASKGTWQYFDSTSTSWKTIGQNMFIRKDVAIRFDPVANFNSQTDTGAGGAKGAVPDLEVCLVESTQGNSAYDNTLCDLTTGQSYISGDLQYNGGVRYSAATTLSINVIAANDAPDIVYTGSGTSPGTPITVNEDTSLAFTGGNLISFTDPDWNERTGGDVTVTLSVEHGKLNLGSTTGLTFENGTANDGKTLTITGSLNDINAAVAGLTYKGDDNYNGTDSLSVHITDKGNASASDGPPVALEANQTIYIQVDAVNDAPVITGPNTGNSVRLNEDGSIVFTGTDKTITLSDVDITGGSGVNDLEVTLTVNNGKISLGQSNGLTPDGGSNLSTPDTTLKFKGSLADINEALKSLTYQPDADWNGSDSLAISVTDNGTGQIGSDQTATKNVTITVVAVNDAPVVESGKETIILPPVQEDSDPAGDTVQNIFGSAYNDSRDTAGGTTADNLAGIVVVGNTANKTTQGEWQYFDGSVWTAIGTGRSDTNGFFLAAGTKIRFAPAQDFNGNAPDLVVRLVDSSAVDAANNPSNPALPGDAAVVSVAGKLGGTNRYSSGTVTLKHVVSAVNDSPVVNGASGGVAWVDCGRIDASSGIVQNGVTVSELFNKFQDNRDQQSSAAHPSGSVENSYAGILITGIPDASYGSWSYSTDGGTTWTVITLPSGQGMLLTAGTSIKFTAGPSGKGEAVYPLTVKLVDDSAGAITSGTTMSLSSADPTNLTDRYSEDVIKVKLYVLGTNTAPTITVPNGLTATERDTTPLQLASTGVIADSDLVDIDWRNATLTIQRDGGANGDDRFVTFNSSRLDTLVQGGNLVFDGVDIGTVVKNSGGELSIKFNQSAKINDVQGVLQSIGYHNDSHAPESQITLRYAISDGNETGYGRQGTGGTLVGETTQDINITAVPEDPTAVDDANTIDASPKGTGQVTGNVLHNDYDPDRTALEVVNHGTLTSTDGYGTLVLNQDGTYQYVIDRSNATVAGLKPGETLRDTFQYTMKDGNGGTTQTAFVVIEIVNRQNDNPPTPDPGGRPEEPVRPELPTDIGGEGETVTPVQNQVDVVRDQSTSQMDSLTTELDRMIREQLETTWLEPVYDLQNMAWSDEIYLRAQPDSRNIYTYYRQMLHLPESMFEHSDPSEQLSLEAIMADGTPLPEWITFDRANRCFTCIPPPDQEGLIELVVLARDSKNAFAKADFSIMIRPPEQLPEANDFRDPDNLRLLEDELEDEVEAEAEGEVKVAEGEPASEAETVAADADETLSLLLEYASESVALADSGGFSRQVLQSSNTWVHIQSRELVEELAMNR